MTVLWLRHPIMSAKALRFRLSHSSVRSFLRSPGQTSLPRYLMTDANNFDKTDEEYLIAPTDDLVRFSRSKPKVKVTAGLGVSSVVKASTSTLGLLVYIALETEQLKNNRHSLARSYD